MTKFAQVPYVLESTGQTIMVSPDPANRASPYYNVDAYNIARANVGRDVFDAGLKAKLDGKVAYENPYECGGPHFDVWWQGYFSTDHLSPSDAQDKSF